MSGTTTRSIRIVVFAIFMIFVKYGYDLVQGFIDTFSTSSKNLAKQYVMEDNLLKIEDLEGWTVQQYADYFLTDLWRIKQLLPEYYVIVNDSMVVNDSVLIDSVYKTRIIRNVKWLEENSSSFLNSNRINDSTNVELQKGMIFFSLITIAKGNSQEKQDFLREDYFRIFKSAENELGDDFNRDSFLIFLKESCYHRYYPYDNEIFEIMKEFK